MLPINQLASLVIMLFSLSSLTQASPALVDSIHASQLQGIKVKSISSLYADKGTLWITDSSNQVFQWKLGTTPTPVITGSKQQKFSSALPISAHRAVVTDINNHQFLIGTDGNWQTFAKEGELEGQLDEPVAAAWSNDGILYIADAGNNRISAFTDTGLFLFSFGDHAAQGDEEENLTQIKAVAVDQHGRVYVLDDYNAGRISIYSSLGELDVTLGKDEMLALTSEPMHIIAMTVRPDGILIVADKKNGRILEIDWENMEVLSQFATIGKGRGQLKRAEHLSLDHDGKLYIADNGNGKIEVFQLDWKQQPWLKVSADPLSIQASSVLASACDVSYIYTAKSMLCIETDKHMVSLRQFDGSLIQTLDTKMRAPVAAAFDQREILILDRSSVHVFDHNGTFKFTFGSKGRRDGELSSPSSLALSTTAVYIADTGNKRVQVFSRNGLFKKVVGKTKDTNQTLKEPIAIAVDKRGNMYVADAEYHQVFIYNAQGTLKQRIGEYEDHPRAFTQIFDIMLDKTNTLYVLAATHNNPTSVWMYQDGQLIYRFSPTAQQATAGIDQQWQTPFVSQAQDIKTLSTDAKQSIAQVIPFAIKSEDPLFAAEEGFFGREAEWVFDPIHTNSDVFALVDASGHARHTFNILRAPSPVQQARLAGDEQHVILTWNTPSLHFTGYYRVYSRPDVSSPFMPNTETIAPHIEHKRTQNQATEYRIAAVSAYGKQSQLSPVFQDHYWLGMLQYQQGNFEQANSLFNLATQYNPLHASAWLYLGKTYIELGQFDAAVNTFKQLASFDSYQQQSLHLQAQALMKKHAWLDVKSLVDDAEHAGNIDATLYGLAAEALIQLDDIPSAIYYLDQAVTLEPTSALWHLKLADANFELGAEDNAKIELIRASQLANQDVDAWIEVAQTYKKHQLYAEAISSYESALLVAPQHMQVLPELAVLHLEQGNLNQAKRLATEMSGIPSLKGTSYYILGRIALVENKAPQALAMLAKAGQTDPDNAEIWLSMANAYAQLNKPQREQEYLKKAATLDTHNFTVYMRLAKACADKQDIPCMLTHYEQATQINPQSIEAHIGLAKALMKSGEMSKASQAANTALKLDPKAIPAYLILADIQNARGMIPDSIATLKKAIAIDDTNMDVHLHLAKSYINNHMYDEAIAITEKAMLLDVRAAEPLVLTGSIYLARQSFDKAISSLEKAVELAPDNAKYRQQLNMAYLQKKRSVDAGGKLLGPKLKQVDYNQVFSAAYKQYTDVPIGKVVLKNEAGIDYSNVKLSLWIKEYMDFPTTMVIEHIAAGAEMEIPLLAAFNNRILDIDEDTGVQTEVRAEYYLAGKPHSEVINVPLTIYGKNAILWEHLDMVGSFTTPKDETLAVFTRQLINAYQPHQGAVNKQVAKAMTVFNGLSAYGIKYLVDPNTPYNKLDGTHLDTVQFPRETLRQRSGDCDDLSILLAAALANLGIETAILDVPQHLLMMFNTGVSADHRDSISANDEALAIMDGKVWIPVEATLIATSFTEAWAEGARKFHLYGKSGKMKIMPLTQAWQTYPPVTLPPADFTVAIPSQEVLGAKIKKEWEILSVKALERMVRPYRMMLALNPNNNQAKMQIAIIYAQNGLYHQASQELNNILSQDANNTAAINNLGNIYYMQKQYKQALSMYEKALSIEPSANIMVNIAMTQYQLGDILQAKAAFAQAKATDEQIVSRYNAFASLLAQ